VSRGDWVDQVWDARFAARLKHGEQSIERIRATDPRWLSILVEEVGEVAHELTYDAVHAGSREEAIRAELIDVIAVASSWADALDHVIEQQNKPPDGVWEDDEAQRYYHGTVTD
jgi:NTP pyrophosphatase (non-canonical NTP hydrolase)